MLISFCAVLTEQLNVKAAMGQGQLQEAMQMLSSLTRWLEPASWTSQVLPHLARVSSMHSKIASDMFAIQPRFQQFQQKHQELKALQQQQQQFLQPISHQVQQQQQQQQHQLQDVQFQNRVLQQIVRQTQLDLAKLDQSYQVKLQDLQHEVLPLVSLRNSVCHESFFHPFFLHPPSVQISYILSRLSFLNNDKNVYKNINK